MKRVCIDCGALTDKRRCPVHQRAYEQRRGSRRAAGHYDGIWRRIASQALREHPWCAVCRTPDTPSNPLTADHIVPLVRGGRNERANVQVLCRAHNSAKGARPEPVVPS